METKEQLLAKIHFFLPALNETELRMVVGFIKGIKKNQG